MKAMKAPPAQTPVPMLDVGRENTLLRNQIDEAMREVCDEGAFVHGPACARFESAMAGYCGTKHAVGCASGSDALVLSLMALGIGPGDEVIVPSFTFFATASAVWRLGARPVFADILPQTFNLDPADVLYKLTTATKAIIPVHLFGQCAQMDEIRQIASAARGIPIVEDACQAIGAEYCSTRPAPGSTASDRARSSFAAANTSRRAGALGTLGCFSFYPTKNLGGFGDGGLITTDDSELAAKLRVLRDHGQQPRYYHQFVGLNSRLDALQAAVLNVKLPYLDHWAEARARHAERYATEFMERGIEDVVIAPTEAAGCRHVWNQFTVRVVDGRRDALHEFLSDRRIGSAVYYPVPLHLQKCFAPLGYEEGTLPITEQACREVLSLPVYPGLTAEEQGAVIDAIETFCKAKVRAVA
jgi:dTDP-4-amino-4,6-dideoxygalactose transaminase